MTDQQLAIQALCEKWRIEDGGLASIRNFIDAAFYHVRLPGTPPADKHLAYDNGIRRATNRIACQGSYGDSRGMSRLLSQGAIELRERILLDSSIEPSKKVAQWMKGVTEEHQCPVSAVEAWIVKNFETATIDDVVHCLLLHPSVIITCDENRSIPSQYRWAGTPEERYGSVNIRPQPVVQGTFEFFRTNLWPHRKARVRKYDAPPVGESA